MTPSLHKIVLLCLKRYSDDIKPYVSGLPAIVSCRRISSINFYSYGQPKSEELPLSYNAEIASLLWLHSVAPGFSLNGSQVSIITEPCKFYEALLEGCSTARKRITLASLYLGTGTLENSLVTAISENLNRPDANLRVKVLLDYTRGSRGQKNSRLMLLPLLEKNAESCQVALYHTPALRGPFRRLVPARYNELIGLQHMKIYLFDDTLLISGANLSNDYFTNRQDRYIVIKNCRLLADFYDELVSYVSRFSLQLDSRNIVSLHPKWHLHPFKSRRRDFVAAARQCVLDCYNRAKLRVSSEGHQSNDDTWVFPLVEMGQLGVHHDSVVTTMIMETALPHSTVHLATGYFNLTQNYMSSIVEHSSAKYNLLMAHPTANGFMGAKGPAGGIPSAYTKLASNFLQQLQMADQGHRIHMAEYHRPGWTYHAKGMWYTLPNQQFPILTLVGSPNFGSRSINRDLETQIVVLTRNEELQKRLKAEQEHLYSRGLPFTEETLADSDRAIPLWVLGVVRFFRSYF